ncbi:alpha/beta hydrolase [Kitasatospora sp. NPDC097643]|uniref:dienelactone hydrolase family protein n=1 Tax=Kitasatospora sp. NPDC097643 TaxID=3157230 RepID=UPI003333752F
MSGPSERHFTVDGVPAVLWSPAGGPGGRPLVLLGHGGGQHRTGPGVLARAHHLVETYGFAAAAIDAPGHGERPKSAQDEQFATAIAELIATGEPVSPEVARHTAELAAQAVPEWRAVLDGLRGLGADGPVGYWGLSLGSVIGVPLVAAEPRIAAAVFGLAGHESLTGPAGRITVPVEFLVQWDDALVPRGAALDLFDALATREKTLHANPGGHLDVPDFELACSARFLARHLR